MNANSGNVSSYYFILPRHQRIDTVMIVTIIFTPQKCYVISKKSDSCCPNKLKILIHDKKVDFVFSIHFI